MSHPPPPRNKRVTFVESSWFNDTIPMIVLSVYQQFACFFVFHTGWSFFLRQLELGES